MKKKNVFKETGFTVTVFGDNEELEEYKVPFTIKQLLELVDCENNNLECITDKNSTSMHFRRKK